MRLPHAERLESRTRSLIRAGRLISDRRLKHALAVEAKHAHRIGQMFEKYDVLLIGRPHDETTLISLAAEIEAERPWVDRRPPVS